jgi:hypothetical protein
VKSFAVRSPLHNTHGFAALGSAPGIAAMSYLASHLAARVFDHASLSGMHRQLSEITLFDK